MDTGIHSASMIRDILALDPPAKSATAEECSEQSAQLNLYIFLTHNKEMISRSHVSSEYRLL